MRFELTIDGSLRTLEEFKENTKSVLQRLLTDRPRRAGLSRPVAHHFIRWSPSPFLTRPQPLCIYLLAYFSIFSSYGAKALYITDLLLAPIRSVHVCSPTGLHTCAACYWPRLDQTYVAPQGFIRVRPATGPD